MTHTPLNRRDRSREVEETARLRALERRERAARPVGSGEDILRTPGFEIKYGDPNLTFNP